MAILTLWAWHVYVFVPLLAPCEGSSAFDRFRRMMGFGAREFAIAVALVAIASSVTLYVRYRSEDGSQAPERRTRHRMCVALAAIVSAALVAGARWMVPLLIEAYSSLGADLPTLTLALFSTYEYWMVILLACLAGLIYAFVRSDYSERQLQIALNGVIGLVVALNLLSSALLFAAVGPLRTLGCVV